MTETRRARAGSLAVLAAVGLLATACSSGATSGAPSHTPVAAAASVTPSRTATHGPASSAPSPAASTSPTPSAGTTTPAGSSSPACGRADLAVSLQVGDGAAGSVYSTLVLTNVGHQACSTGGFAAVSYVGRGNGTQLGAAADQVGRAKTLTLQPGASARATLQESNPDNYPTDKCDPAAADGLRVYPPSQTASSFIRHATEACVDPSVHLLSVSAFRVTAG
ncbi:MAG: DUF4232 domain-containing protein [Nocardioidaceae bacterium]